MLPRGEACVENQRAVPSYVRLQPEEASPRRAMRASLVGATPTVPRA